MIKSFELEKKVLSGVLQHQNLWPQIALLIKEDDFFSKETVVHLSIFRLLRNALNNREVVDDTILVERLKNLGVSFPDDINLPEYIFSLNRYKIPEQVFMTAVSDLKKITLRRVVYESGARVQSFVKEADPSLTYQEMLSKIDDIHNKTIADFESIDTRSVDLCAMAEPLIEELGNNPPKEIGLMSPYKTINKVYGSIFRGGNITCIAARAKVGKMLKLSEKILTPTGWTTHGEIREGGQVITPSGKIANVIGYFPHKKKDIYRITFSDGRTVDAGLDHLWNVWGRHDGGRWKYKVIDTETIIEYLKHPSKAKKIYIDLVSDIPAINNDFLEVDPYVMGVMIGDGHFSKGNYHHSFTSGDDEIINRVLKLFKCCKPSKKRRGCKQVCLSKKSKNYFYFDKSGLSQCRAKDKFIPKEYLTSSRLNRLEILRGLMDTDGTVTKTGAVEYYTISRELAKDVQELVWSLGGICKIKIKEAYIGDVKYNDCYRLQIRLSENPFYLSRKAERWNRSKALRLRINSVEKLSNKEDCACIKIDSEDELYVTSNYVVTHNTTMILDCCLKTSYYNSVPILHFDNGEMSEKELIFRIVSSMSGVPQYMLEKGTWRNSSYNGRSPKELVESVRSVWSKLKKTKILYENVAGMSAEDMMALLKRKYYSEVGRGNPMIFSFDYLKTDFNNLGKGAEWAFVGKTLHGFKQTITKDLKFDGEPVVSMITSVQLNRLGITTNRTAENVHETETENAIGLSDNIIQFVSHLFQLRKKTVDERVTYGERFGTHSLKCLAARHLGEEYSAHINPIETPEGAKDNFINFNFHNFAVDDCGDLRDIVAASNGVTLGQTDDLPL